MSTLTDENRKTIADLYLYDEMNLSDVNDSDKLFKLGVIMISNDSARLTSAFYDLMKEGVFGSAAKYVESKIEEQEKKDDDFQEIKYIDEGDVFLSNDITLTVVKIYEDEEIVEIKMSNRLSSCEFNSSLILKSLNSEKAIKILAFPP